MTFYIFNETPIGWESSTRKPYGADTKEQALEKFFKEEGTQGISKSYFIADTNKNFADDYFKWKEECKAEEALWTRRIEL